MAKRNSTRNLNKLTATTVKNAQPQEKPYRLVDGGGLVLTIKPARNEENHIIGSRKYWQMRYRFAGKENTASLGVYPDVTLADARNSRADIKKQLRDNINPNKLKRQEAQEAVIAQENSFRSVAEKWYKLKRPKWKSDKYATQVWTSLDTHVLNYIGDTPIGEITEDDIDTIMERMHGAGIYETASRVLQRMVSIFGLAQRRLKLIKSNPAKGADEFLEIPDSAKDNHHPALEEKDMPQFLADYAQRGVRIQTKTALRLLMLTAVRTSELIEATWDEIDLKAKNWTIPAARMKMGRDHVVPLSTQAVEAFKIARANCRKSNLVFPGLTKDKPISNNTVLFSIYKTEDKDGNPYRGRMTGHGFRSVFSTHLNALKTKPKDGEGQRIFNIDAIEFQLAHAQRNKVRGSYDRNQYLDERKRIMDYWGSVCASWEGGNVAPLFKVAS